MLAAHRHTKAVLIDLSGTLHIGQNPIPSCISALQRLRSAKIPFRICSNTSKESTSCLLSRLRAMGFEIHDSEMFTSLGACRELLRIKGVKRPYLLLTDSAMEDFSNLPSEFQSPNGTGYDAVVIGLAPERLTYQHLNTAFRILHNSPHALITTHKARYFQDEQGLSLGPGGFVAALEYALGERASSTVVVGKPTVPFFRTVLESLRSDGIEERDWEHVIVVGDDVEADLGGGALELGMRRVLVKTGKYRDGDEYKGLAPDQIHESFATFVDCVLIEVPVILHTL